MGTLCSVSHFCSVPVKALYGDGQPVKVVNVTEVETFARFVAEKKGPPASRAALLDY